MLRLGGANITSADPAVSSAAKGESLADTIRVIANYADVVVIRHPRDGAARLAAEYSQIPVINGGDGSHEHPTQTLCDLFTLKSKNKALKNMKVAISGDLKGSRTIHSFVYALARFGATIDPLPAPGMELPAHVDRRLREEFHCRMVSKDPGQLPAARSTRSMSLQINRTSSRSFPSPKSITVSWCSKKTDAVYVTRFQKERWAEKERPYPKIDAKFLDQAKYSEASVMHPLPRVNELDASFDSDRRAIYFQQAAYGVPIRMALISLMLHLHKNKSLHKFPAASPSPTIRSMRSRSAPVCIATTPIASPPILPNGNMRPTSSTSSRKTRHGAACCAAFTARKTSSEGTDAQFVVADTARKTFSPGLAALAGASADKLKHVVIYPTEADALAAGFAPREGGKKARAS